MDLFQVILYHETRAVIKVNSDLWNAHSLVYCGLRMYGIIEKVESYIVYPSEIPSEPSPAGYHLSPLQVVR
jgi:hypothetical protein